MCELRVGLIAEGKTDLIMMKAIVKQKFPEENIIYTDISPTDAELLQKIPKAGGFGWKSVYLACRDLDTRLEMQEAAGLKFDLLMIHLDADVAQSNYSVANIEADDDISEELPCYEADKDIRENCEKLQQIAMHWIGNDETASIPVWCIPHIDTDLWVAYCFYPDDRERLSELMDNKQLNTLLLTKGKNPGRLISRKNDNIKKRPRVFQQAVENLSTTLWQDMCGKFVQAKALDDALNVKKLSRCNKN